MGIWYADLFLAHLEPTPIDTEMKGLFVFALVGAALAFPSAQQPDVVDLGYAKYLGNRTYTNAVAYLGIPYAEPPLGELRFRAPLPLNTKRVEDENQGKTVNATAYPAFCIQGSTGGESTSNNPISAGFHTSPTFKGRDAGGAGSEDCLKVNVYTPAGAKKRSKRKHVQSYCEKAKLKDAQQFLFLSISTEAVSLNISTF